jgi:hypothetical protein
MKTSPLQLDFVIYPKLSFEARVEGDPERDSPQEVEVEARVSYSRDGEHSALLSVRSTKKDEVRKFDFEIDAFAKFRMDLDGARLIYRNERYPITAAVNVARIVYSGARELLSTVTARSPYSTLNIESVLLNAEDVVVDFGDEGAPVEFAKEYFGVDLAQIAPGAAAKKSDAVSALQPPETGPAKKTARKTSGSAAGTVATKPKSRT